MLFCTNHFFWSFETSTSIFRLPAFDAEKSLRKIMSRSVTMYHYMRSVKKNKFSRHGALKSAKAALNDINQKQSMHTRSPFGLFALLPREMRFRIFGFTPLSGLGQLSLTSRLLTDEVVNYIHSKDALHAIVPNIQFKNEQESSELFINAKTEYCWNHFKDLGETYNCIIFQYWNSL